MNNFTFYSPTFFSFGKDTENETGTYVKRFGGHKVLIHYGGGSVVRSGLLDRVKASLDKEGIPYQLEVSDGGTTDGSAIHLTKEGIPTGVLSVPTRYIHTTVSVASMEDVENTIKLIVAAIDSLE